MKFEKVVLSTLWLNVYEGEHSPRLLPGAKLYDSKEEAERHGPSRRRYIGAFPVTFEKE